jgi:uncharacterized membrane protein
VHPALSDFPLALLAMAFVADCVGAITGLDFWWRVSFWLVVAGLCSAVPTATAGLLDYATIDEQSPASKTGMLHMLVMLTAILAFGVGLIIPGRGAAPRGAAEVATIALDAFGTACLMLGGWYGGALVFKHGIGRTDEANPR